MKSAVNDSLIQFLKINSMESQQLQCTDVFTVFFFFICLMIQWLTTNDTGVNSSPTNLLFCILNFFLIISFRKTVLTQEEAPQFSFWDKNIKILIQKFVRVYTNNNNKNRTNERRKKKLNFYFQLKMPRVMYFEEKRTVFALLKCDTTMKVYRSGSQVPPPRWNIYIFVYNTHCSVCHGEI